ncbi:MAG: hypothetical protein AAFX50_11255, partial [Acidobacteriota bacterium]
MWPLGNPWNTAAPPPGRASIDFEAGYVLDSGVRWYRLLTGGLVAEAEVDASGPVAVMRIRVLGKAQRTANAKVTVRYLPGHGTPRGTMVAVTAGRAGEADVSLPVGRPVRKALELVEDDWLGPCQELMELEGYHLTHDEDGVLTGLPRLVDFDAEPVMVLRARDMLQGTLGIRWIGGGQVPTTLILTSEEELHDASNPCGRTTTRKVVETFAFETPRRARWRLVGSSIGPWTLQPVGPEQEGDPVKTLTRRVVTETERACKTVIGTKTSTYGLHNLRTWRYELVDNGDPDPGEPQIFTQNVDKYLLEDNPQSDGEGSEHLYLWPVARLILESEVWDQNIYDDADNYLVEKRKAAKGLVLQRVALKGDGMPRSEGWESIPLRLDTHVMGDGEGCIPDAREMYSPGTVGVPEPSTAGPLWGEFTSLETIAYSIEGGYIVGEQHRRSASHLPAGDLYYFRGGATSSVDREVFGLVSGKDVIYSAITDDAASKLEIPLDFSADPGGRATEPVEPVPLQGYLPQAQRLNDGSTEEGVRGNTRLLEAKCRSPKLAANHIPYEPDPARVEYAEDQADLDSLCLQRLREGSPIPA